MYFSICRQTVTKVIFVDPLPYFFISDVQTTTLILKLSCTTRTQAGVTMNLRGRQTRLPRRWLRRTWSVVERCQCMWREGRLWPTQEEGPMSSREVTCWGAPVSLTVTPCVPLQPQWVTGQLFQVLTPLGFLFCIVQ